MDGLGVLLILLGVFLVYVTYTDSLNEVVKALFA